MNVQIIKNDIRTIRRMLQREPSAKEIYQAQQMVKQLTEAERHEMWRANLVADINAKFA